MIVVEDVATALEIAASGSDVVLVLAEGADPGRLPQGPGRVAVLIGDPGDPRTLDAAESMYAELFGPRG